MVSNHNNELPAGFKMTELGPIPEEWGVARLQHIVAEITSGDWGEERPNNDTVPCYVLRGTDFSRAEKNILTNTPVRHIKSVSLQKRELSGGEILVELSGGSKDQPTGRALLITETLLSISHLPILFSNFVKRLRIKPIYHPNFISRYLEFIYKKGGTRVYEKRTTGIRNFKLGDFLANEHVPLPSIPEQRAIAHVLSTIQRATEAQDKLIAAASELKKSIMRHLFAYGPVPVSEADTVPLKETEIGPVPEHWEVVKLGDVVTEEIRNGAFLRRDRFGDGIAFLNVADTYGHVSADFRFMERVKVTDSELELYEIKTNDLFYVRSSLKREGVGQCCIIECVTEPAIYDCHLMRVRVDFNRVIPKYLAYFSVSILGKESLISRSKTTTMTTINQHGLASFAFSLPPHSIQQDIANLLTAVDKKIEAEQNSKAALQTLFKTMLHLLMTGQLRVKDLEV